MTGLDPAVPGNHKPITTREQPLPGKPTATDPDRTVQIGVPKLAAIDPERTDQFEMPARQPSARAPAWLGEFRPFSVGDPGRAAGAPSYPDPKFWDRPDTVLDGVLLKAADGLPAMQLRAASVRGR